MRRLMEMVLHKRLDLMPLITHRFKLDQIKDAYELFAGRRDNVIKVAIEP
jgi:threonine dehydrogenase-like Zn-dependent dehydrogenase